VSYKRVLAILKGYLGDAVMATPLLESLSHQPDLQVEVLTAAPVITLLEDTFPNVKFIEQGKLASPSGLLHQAQTLRPKKFDLALVVNRSFRSALLASLAHIPERVGHSKDLRGWLLTSKLPNDKCRYEAACYLDLGKRAGLPLSDLHPKLIPSECHLGPATTKLAGATIGIQPGASNFEKRLPIPVLAKVVRALQNEGSVVLLGGPEEKSAGQELEDELSNKPLNLIGALSLKESTAAVSQLKAMLGGDTGLMHIAAATGCPTVTMFGPTVASKWGHHYEPHQVLVSSDMKMTKFDSAEIVAAVRRTLCG
jgi:lipopolysaccharide heptosyltransferase II